MLIPTWLEGYRDLHSRNGAQSILLLFHTVFLFVKSCLTSLRPVEVIRKASILYQEFPGTVVFNTTPHLLPFLRRLLSPNKHSRVSAAREKGAAGWGPSLQAALIRAEDSMHFDCWSIDIDVIPAQNAAGLISVYTEHWAETQSPYSRSLGRWDCFCFSSCLGRRGRRQLGPFPECGLEQSGLARVLCSRDSCTADADASSTVRWRVSVSDRRRVKLLMVLCLRPLGLVD